MEGNKNYDNSYNFNNSTFGQFGLRVLTTDANPDETFVAIQALEESVISSNLTSIDENGTQLSNSLNSDTVITSLTLPIGTIIYGRFVKLEVASGKVIAYKG